jgi:hypothetical protein
MKPTPSSRLPTTATDQGGAAFELFLDTSGTKKILFNGLITSADYSATVGELEVITCNFVTNWRHHHLHLIMAFYRGEQGTVFFDKDSSGGVSEIAAVRSWSLTVEKDVLETTAQGATYKANIGGLVAGSGSMELMYDAPSAGDKT